MVILLDQSNVVALEKVFTDGTKLESFANRYTFVWMGRTEKSKERLERKIKPGLNAIESGIAQEAQGQEKNEPFTPMSSEGLDRRVAQLNTSLAGKGAGKKVLKQVEKLQSEALLRLQEYEGHLQRWVSATATPRPIPMLHSCT